MSHVPSYLHDTKDLLTDKGFATSDTWYHGTSTALLESIKEQGLKRSGDKALKQTAKKTMTIIGNHYTESIEPIFLTQSKELAYYWAEQTLRERSLRFGREEEAIVLAIKLPESLRNKVKSDVGAASMLLVKSNSYLFYLNGIYQSHGHLMPTIDLLAGNRMDYLNKLGMAYLNEDIDVQYVQVLLDKDFT